MRFALLILTLVTTRAAADTEIYRCVLEDGTVAFQETPCLEVATVDDDGSADVESNRSTPVDDGFFDFVNPYDEAPSAPATSTPTTAATTTLPEAVSQDRSTCEKTTRDAIDAIDLEMRETSYSKDQGEEYLSELLALTRQLRACKQL